MVSGDGEWRCSSLALQPRSAVSDNHKLYFSPRPYSISGTLYTAYTDVISKSVIGFSEEDGKSDDDNVTKAYEVCHMSACD